MNRSLRVAFYVRVAVPHCGGPDRLASQIAALRQRIASDGAELEPEFEFVDNGFSGVTLVRPALERLRQQAAQGALDRLYIEAPARLTRSAAHHFLLVEEFGRAGVEVIFLEANSQV
jgi:site-specific DNA recombinase